MIDGDRLNLMPEWMQRLIRQLNYKNVPMDTTIVELIDWCLRNNWEIQFAPLPKDDML